MQHAAWLHLQCYEGRSFKYLDLQLVILEAGHKTAVLEVLISISTNVRKEIRSSDSRPLLAQEAWGFRKHLGQ